MAKEDIFKKFTEQNSPANIIVGAIVVLIVAIGIVGLVRNRSASPVLPPGSETKQTEQGQNNQTGANLPTKHTVAEGEDLWKISEKYYGTGLNWVDIVSENNLTNPDSIFVGMELTIPKVAPRKADESMQPGEMASPTPAEQSQQTTKGGEPVATGISGNSYTVAAGDTIWDIALRAYGDGYKWKDIVKANNLANPDHLLVGTVLTLPR